MRFASVFSLALAALLGSSASVARAGDHCAAGTCVDDSVVVQQAPVQYQVVQQAYGSGLQVVQRQVQTQAYAVPVQQDFVQRQVVQHSYAVPVQQQVVVQRQQQAYAVPVQQQVVVQRQVRQQNIGHQVVVQQQFRQQGLRQQGRSGGLLQGLRGGGRQKTVTKSRTVTRTRN